MAGCAGSGCKQCWGCGQVLHRICAGLVEWPPGPFHCSHSPQQFTMSWVRDITLDGPLMHVVGGGVVLDLAEKDQTCCKRAAAWFHWDG